MLFVPLPFVVALLLLILFVMLLRSPETSGNRAFLALIALCAFHSIILGLRWGYGISELRIVMPVLGACLPPLVYASFRSLIHHDQPQSPIGRLVYAVPPLCILTLVLLAPALIDVALVTLFVGYAFAVHGLGRAGPDALDEARLEGALPAYRALNIAAASLCVFAVFDLVVFLDFEWTKGANVGRIVTSTNLLGLLLIGLTAMVAARAQAVSENEDSATRATSSAEDQDALKRLEGLMTEQRLYRDDNLNLSRLARRAGLPARTLSGAVNRLTGKNISQYVNDYRIAEACRLLKGTEMSVTNAMFEAGFQTKSNFNREFRRLTNLSPAAWREQNRQVSQE